MDVPYPETGRSRQKQRTRSAIVDAASRMAREGVVPTVAEAAEEAAVSRATAYRYFPSQESLLTEVATAGALAPPDELLAPLPQTGGVARRVDVLVQALTSFMVEHDPGLRMMLKVSLERSLEGDVPVRAGRRAAYLEAALTPLEAELGEAHYRRMSAVVGMVVGTEALAVLRDVYGLETAEARALMRWAASTLFAAASDPDGTLADLDVSP